MRKLFRNLLLPAALLMSACHTHEDEVAASLADVVFTMEGGDEALSAMLTRTATQDPVESPAWLQPTEGVTLPAEVTALQWQNGALVLRWPSPQRRNDEVGSVVPRAAVLALPGWLVADAWAHGAPVSGRATLLEVNAADGSHLLRVFSKGQSYLPTAAQWQALKGKGKLTGRLTAARFADDKVVDGPWRAADVTFEVAP